MNWNSCVSLEMLMLHIYKNCKRIKRQLVILNNNCSKKKIFTYTTKLSMYTYNLLFQDLNRKITITFQLRSLAHPFQNLLHANLAAIHVMFCSFLHRFFLVWFAPRLLVDLIHSLQSQKQCSETEKKREKWKWTIAVVIFSKCNKIYKSGAIFVLCLFTFFVTK